MRHWFIDPSAATAHGVAGSWALLAVPIGLVLAILVVGFWYFNREAPRIAEEL
jgi:ABC-2 type transport system permease protein